MTKAEQDVMQRLLGCRHGPYHRLPGPIRDVIGGRVHKVCAELEGLGIGTITLLPHAFIFTPYAMQ